MEPSIASTSTMAPSTTRPWPLVRASSSAQAMPKARPKRAGGVADHGRRHDGPLAAVCRQRQQSRQRDVVQVVPGRLRQRPALAPAGHAAVDQPRVARGAVGRPEAQALHHAGAVAFDQRVGGGDERHRLGDRGGLLQIEQHDGLAAAQRVVARAAEPFVHGPFRGRAITVTSAPMSASMRPASGPGPMPSNSTTRTTRQRRLHANSFRAIRSFMISVVPP